MTLIEGAISNSKRSNSFVKKSEETDKIQIDEVPKKISAPTHAKATKQDDQFFFEDSNSQKGKELQK